MALVDASGVVVVDDGDVSSDVFVVAVVDVVEVEAVDRVACLSGFPVLVMIVEIMSCSVLNLT